MDTTQIKLVVVGDGGVGKSCLLISQTTGSFPSDYVPTVFDNYVHNMQVDGRQVDISLWDLAGQEDYDRLRPLSYPETDVFLLCFSVASQSSFSNVQSKWIDEIRHFCPSTPILLIGCKADLRSSTKQLEMVSSREASLFSSTLGSQYFECSALTREGLSDVFQNAVRAVWHNEKSNKSPFWKRKKSPVPLPPVMPPAGKAPWIEIETSTFANNWKKVLESSVHYDVTIHVLSVDVKVHTIMMCSASEVFRAILNKDDCNQLKRMKWVTDTNLPKGIAKVDTTDDAISITMSTEIDSNIFAHILEFLYTGQIEENIKETDLEKVKEQAAIFNLPRLESICLNRAKEEDFLNPSIGTYLNDETGQVMKELFFNKNCSSDVKFLVEGKTIYGHKVVLSARSDVMSAMFSGSFSEGVTKQQITIIEHTHECFLAMLEYLYTDHSPIENVNTVDLLILANEFCLPRLVNLCELYITKQVDKSVVKSIEKADIDVIALLLTAQLHNAQQLENWCLHFISTNYTAFSNQPQFEQLVGLNRDYVEDHQWPPVSYLDEVKEYEVKMVGIKKANKCSIM